MFRKTCCRRRCDQVLHRQHPVHCEQRGRDARKKAEEQEQETLKEEAAAREEDPVVRRERLFRERCVQCGIEVDKSDAWNTARAKCLSIVDQRWFQGTVLVLIVISSVCAACSATQTGPRLVPRQRQMEAIWRSLVHRGLLIEMVLKLVSLTVYSGPNAYIKDYWNCLDGFIVTMSIVTLLLDLISGGSTGGVLKVFSAALRVASPAAPAIKNVLSLKLVIDATFVSMPAIMTVCGMGLLCFLVLGVLGMQLFKGRFTRARTQAGTPGAPRLVRSSRWGVAKRAFPLRQHRSSYHLHLHLIHRRQLAGPSCGGRGLSRGGEGAVHNNRRVNALFYWLWSS